MKSFILIATQSGGCDYTIGCGVNYWFEYAESLEDLIAEVESKLTEESECGDYDDYNLYPGRLNMGRHGEGCYDSLNIYEISDSSHSVPLEELIERVQKKRKASEDKEEGDAERKEYERLAKKFDPKFKPKVQPKPKLEKVCNDCGKDFSTKTKSAEKCNQCKKKDKKKAEEERVERERVSSVKIGLSWLLSKLGWKDKGYDEVYLGKAKVDHYGRIYLYDSLTMKGKKKTYSFRMAKIDEAIEGGHLPQEAVDYINKNKDVFYG